MNVTIYDLKKPSNLDRKIVFQNSLDQLLKKSDIVSLHLPKTPKTVGMVNKAFLSKMKADAVLINTSRGDIVKEADLIAHLNAKKKFWYAADVWQKEPADKAAKFASKLAMHPRVYGTHHIGASTTQSENAIGQEAYRMILEYTKSKNIPNCVNPKKK